MNTKTESQQSPMIALIHELMDRYREKFPVTWHHTLMLLRSVGYWVTPKMLGQMIDDAVVLCPVGETPSSMEFYPNDLEAVMTVLDERRSWLAISANHDEKRTRQELVSIAQKQPIIDAYSRAAGTKPLYEVLEFLIDEEDRDLQQVIFLHMKDRLVSLECGGATQ